MYRILVTWVGKIIIRLTRLFGHGGSALPGLIIETISPHYISKVAKKISGGAVLVTGTNGKTSTTKMIAGIFEHAGRQVIYNRSGSNMSRGIATALAEQSSLFGQPKGEIALFEVDEAFVGDVSAKLKPQVIVVLNLLRDQLDRYGELNRTAELIGKGLLHAKHIVLNGDDQLVANLAGQAGSAEVTYFGAKGKLQQELPDDASLLQKTASKIKNWVRHHSEHAVVLAGVKEINESQQVTYLYQDNEYQAQLPLPGIYNAYNGAAALAAAACIGLDLKKAADALAHITPAFGRTETIDVGGKTLQLLLVKNPAGFNQVIKTFLISQNKLPLLIAINDNIADGRDVSWLWDVDFEMMAHKRHQILASGNRGYDLSLRLKYAEINSTTERDLTEALKVFIKGLSEGQKGYVVPTYTAMLKLRSLLAKQTDVKEMWQ